MSSPSTTNPFLAPKLLQTTTLLVTGLSSGISLSLSVFVTPRLLESPTPLMLRQWRHTYALGAATMPLTAVAAGAAYAWLALRAPGPRGRALLTAAAALTAGIVPYTWACMLGVNKRLVEKEREVAALEKGGAELTAEEEIGAKGLVDFWGMLNLGRAGMLIAGTACGLAATVF
ncbi:Noranthrone monooxygenase [Madurella mycetomatis]|uniref:Noranthrone monooxygenase n=1 Tax=Madurella mycetomatis TaxID=100816 RepID=A0A175W1N0_9PEZI|nr:Noranthrone monooxygenase [Madurella mycetomatis]